jgi:carboxypeptidase D
MLYIEQPVGTGYSQGTPNIENEDDLAAQFVGFLQQFLEIFPELKGKTTYLTGESVSSELPFIGLWVLNSIRCCLVCRDVRSMWVVVLYVFGIVH